jgi:hypothetical protein
MPNAEKPKDLGPQRLTKSEKQPVECVKEAADSVKSSPLAPSASSSASSSTGASPPSKAEAAPKQTIEETGSKQTTNLAQQKLESEASPQPKKTGLEAQALKAKAES